MQAKGIGNKHVQQFTTNSLWYTLSKIDASLQFVQKYKFYPFEFLNVIQRIVSFVLNVILVGYPGCILSEEY